MDSSLSEECVGIVGDAHMTMLQGEAISEEVPEIGDDIEELRKSLREVVHDESVQPKLQCLMMDPSFSMVTVQGEDSGIQWETTPSRCSTPSVYDCGTSNTEFCSPVMPGSAAAGRITIIMDEEKIVRRKRTKETGSGRRSMADRKTPLSPVDVSDDATGRPELVEVSQPNVKAEGEGEEMADPTEEKEQRLFRLVCEGSEILNIVVPPKLASVDEEESKVMEDNLSYLEDTPVTKHSSDAIEEVFDPSFGVSVSGQIPTELGSDQSTNSSKASQPTGPHMTDPPGAPVSRPPRRGAVGDMDYFETFTQLDSQAAPGSPAVVLVGPEETEAGKAGENCTSKEPEQPKESNAPLSVEQSSSAAIGREEITSEHLDEMFYGGTDIVINKRRDESAPHKCPLKESGSALFGSQEDILTPIFLSPGPPKIIDPALLDEPTAMAFLYTDLYEEALGSRQKDEDAESMTSERSFHSRHSDREERGYLEKFVLKDETPVVEMEPTEGDRSKGEGFRNCMSEDPYNLGGLLSQDEAEKKGDVSGAEEEITDFLRTSASSSPEPFPPPLEGEVDVTKPKKKQKLKAEGKDPKKAQFVPQSQSEVSGVTPGKESVAHVTDRDELPTPSSSTDEAGGESVPRHPVVMASPQKRIPPAQVQVQPSPESNSGITSQAPKPVAPPKRKTILELAPLTPVETAEERGGVAEGVKEQREEEKETASPAETADEGEGDGEKVGVPSSLVPSVPSMADNEVSQQEVVQVSETELVKGEDSYNEREEQKTKQVNASPGVEVGTLKDGSCEREPAEGETGATDSEPAESAKIEVEPEARRPRVTESATKGSVTEPAKETGRCIIL